MRWEGGEMLKMWADPQTWADPLTGLMIIVHFIKMSNLRAMLTLKCEMLGLHTGMK